MKMAPRMSIHGVVVVADDAVNADVERVGQPLRGVPDEPEAGHLRLEPPPEPLAQLQQGRRALSEPLSRQLSNDISE